MSSYYLILWINHGVLFRLTIVLSVLRFKDSIDTSGIFKRFLQHFIKTQFWYFANKRSGLFNKKKRALFFLSNTNASGTHLFETRLMNDSSCVITWVQKSIVWERGHNSSVYLGTHPEKQSYNFSIRPLFCFRCILSMTCI